MSRRERPDRVRVRYFDVEYWLDLHRCRSELVNLEVHGKIASLTELAINAGVSRSTASRFFAGKHHSSGTARGILNVLGLEMFDVLTLVKPDEQ